MQEVRERECRTGLAADGPGVPGRARHAATTPRGSAAGMLRLFFNRAVGVLRTQQFLYLRPLPEGQWSLRPILGSGRM